MTAPIDATGSATEAQPEAVLGGIEAKAIEGRSLGQIAWMRLKRDKVGIGAAVVIVLLLLIATFAYQVDTERGPVAASARLRLPKRAARLAKGVRAIRCGGYTPGRRPPGGRAR